MADKSAEKFFREMNVAFVIGDVDFLSRHLAEDVVWDREGRDTIEGKQAFLAHVEEMDIKDDVEMTIDEIDINGSESAVSGKMTVKHNGGNAEQYAYRDVYQVAPGNDRVIKKLVSQMKELS
ncbi:nuclear transport factor 2 family protein [Planococcus sp. FY231025]|uniref:nuclear transport factor 2 family protein n=1 Tax=Planococcus sp. FY231025 TaxID=3455699 RepID=UPI003F8EEA3A